MVVRLGGYYFNLKMISVRTQVPRTQVQARRTTLSRDYSAGPTAGSIAGSGAGDRATDISDCDRLTIWIAEDRNRPAVSAATMRSGQAVPVRKRRPAAGTNQRIHK